MRKCKIVLIALLPITLLLLLLTFDADLRNYMNNRHMKEAIKNLSAMSDFGYTLTFETKFASGVDDKLLVKDLVQVNQIKDDKSKEYHRIEALKKSEADYFSYSEIISAPSLESTLLLRTSQSGKWEEKGVQEMTEINLLIVDQLIETMENNKDHMRLRKKNDTKMYFRIYQPELLEEDWYKALPEDIQSRMTTLKGYRKYEYFIDIIIDKESHNILSLQFDYSALADYISVINQFIKEGDSEPNFEMNYKINAIKPIRIEIEVPKH